MIEHHIPYTLYTHNTHTLLLTLHGCLLSVEDAVQPLVGVTVRRVLVQLHDAAQQPIGFDDEQILVLRDVGLVDCHLYRSLLCGDDGVMVM